MVRPQRFHGERTGDSISYCRDAESYASLSYEVDWSYSPEAMIFADGLPVSIFRGTLSSLQAAVFWLRKEGLSFSKIASLLGRAESTIRNTYLSAAGKNPLLRDDESGLRLPLSEFSRHPSLSPLEVVVNYLLSLGLRNVDVASILGLDPRTTHTIKSRIKKKGVVVS